MRAILRARATLLAVAFAIAVFAASFALLHDAPVFLPHQGVQSVLAAHSLMAGRGFEVAPGIPFAKFGPLYPLLLAALGAAGLEATPALYAVNCAALAATLFALVVLGRMLGLRSAWAVAAFALVWAANHYVLRAARPDLLATALSFLGLAGMVAYALRPTVPWLLATAVACSAAALTRYQAVLTLLPMFGIAMLLLRAVPWRRRLVHLAVFAGLGAGPIALWMVRNQRLTGFWTGLSRTASREQWAEHYGLGGNVLGLLKTIWIDAFAYDAVGTRPVVYGDVALPWPALALFGAVVATSVLLALAWRGRRGILRRLGADVASVLCAAQAVWFALTLVVVWTLSNNDPIETRYVAPIYGLVLLAVAVIVAESRGAGDDRRRRIARLAAIALVIALTGVPNALKSSRLLSNAAPGPTYMPITAVGPRGTNWMAPLTWADVERASPGAA